MGEERLERRLIQAVKRESARIQEEEWGIGGLKEREMIAFWRAQCPRMTARLEQAGILEEFAHLLVTRASDATTAYQRAGMGWPDSREEANKDWLIYDPEDPDAPPDEEGDGLAMLLERLAHQERIPRRVRVHAQRIKQARAASGPTRS